MTKEIKTVTLTSLKSLGGIAPVFDMPVKISRIDGTKAVIVCKIKGMKRTEWAALRDAQIANMVAAAESATDSEERATLVGRVQRDVKNAAEIISQAATGWYLEEEFCPENLEAMEDLLPGALEATLASIDVALFQGRLGN